MPIGENDRDAIEAVYALGRWRRPVTFRQASRRRSLELLRVTYLRPGRVHRIPLGPGGGLRLEVTANASIHTSLGTAELELARHVRRLARPGKVCFDIGCHDGYYSMLFARLTGVAVVGFESEREAVARIHRNLARNPAIGSRIVVRNDYVSDEMARHPNAVALDDLIEAAEVPAPDVLKIDVDGGEVAVLYGARQTLATLRPHVIVEVHSPDLERDCAELLSGFGYRVIVVAQRKRFRQNRPAAHNRWLVATAASAPV